MNDKFPFFDFNKNKIIQYIKNIESEEEKLDYMIFLKKLTTNVIIKKEISKEYKKKTQRIHDHIIPIINDLELSLEEKALSVLEKEKLKKLEPLENIHKSMFSHINLINDLQKFSEERRKKNLRSLYRQIKKVKNNEPLTESQLNVERVLIFENMINAIDNHLYNLNNKYLPIYKKFEILKLKIEDNINNIIKSNFFDHQEYKKHIKNEELQIRKNKKLNLNDKNHITDLTNKNFLNNSKIQWIGKEVEIIYLFEQLYENGKISKHDYDKMYKRIEDHFINEKGKPFKYRNLIQSHSNYLNNDKHKPRTSDQIDNIVSNINE